MKEKEKLFLFNISITIISNHIPTKNNLILNNIITGIYLYPGIADMMQDLKAAGYQLVVLSNKDDPDVASVLNHYFDEPPFTVMRGHLPGVPLKPDPAAALNIAKELGIAPADFWYLGDTPTDLATCRGAGMNFIAVAWGFRSRQELSEAGAERIADTPAQALEYMLK